MIVYCTVLCICLCQRRTLRSCRRLQFQRCSALIWLQSFCSWKLWASTMCCDSASCLWVPPTVISRHLWVVVLQDYLVSDGISVFVSQPPPAQSMVQALELLFALGGRRTRLYLTLSSDFCFIVCMWSHQIWFWQVWISTGVSLTRWVCEWPSSRLPPCLPRCCWNQETSAAPRR